MRVKYVQWIQSSTQTPSNFCSHFQTFAFSLSFIKQTSLLKIINIPKILTRLWLTFERKNWSCSDEEILRQGRTRSEHRCPCGIALRSTYMHTVLCVSGVQMYVVKIASFYNRTSWFKMYICWVWCISRWILGGFENQHGGMKSFIWTRRFDFGTNWYPDQVSVHDIREWCANCKLMRSSGVLSEGWSFNNDETLIGVY